MTDQPSPHLPKTVIITGASTGIGRACALHLDQQGWRVFAGVRRQADADSLQAEASARVTPLFIDITRPDSINAAAAEVERQLDGRGLHGLVNNAGIAIGGPLEFLPIDKLRTQLEINVIGQIAVTQALLPLLRRAQGRVVNMSSVSGRAAMPFNGPYAASKFALEALTDALRVELRPWQMEVICIEPGAIATPIWEKSLHTSDQALKDLPPAYEQLYGANMELMRKAVRQTAARGISPEQVARVVATALTARRPKTRYLVGADAKMGALLGKFLPDRLRDWLIVTFAGRA